MNETPPIPNQTPQTVAAPSKKFIVIGILVGAFIGFLLRPSAMLVGQLPFTVVITRGANLEGLDQLIVPLAQTSFNYMLVGGVVGGLAGLVAPKYLPKKCYAAQHQNKAEADRRTYPSATTHCFIVSAGDRQGPFLPEQLRSMWRAGAVTATATVSWDDHAEPVKLSSLMDNSLFNTPTPPSEPSGDRKAIGAMVAGPGVLLVIFAIVQLNSIESQLKRGIGQTDEIPVILLFLGVPAVLTGLIMSFAPPMSK